MVAGKFLSALHSMNLCFELSFLFSVLFLKPSLKWHWLSYLQSLLWSSVSLVDPYCKWQHFSPSFIYQLNSLITTGQDWIFLAVCVYMCKAC